MKKTFLLLCMMASTMIASATDLWEGTHDVTWSNTLTIEANLFADMQLGQKIVIEYSNATDVIELHSNGAMLPGTRYAQYIDGQGEIEVFSTPAMLASLKNYGLELCGPQFTVTKVWYGDGKDNVDENTVWTGFFWMDEWSTLELAKTAFNGIDWSKYKAIRFYSEAGRTDYVINVMTKWGDGGKLGDQGTMTMTNDYAELSLEGIDMAAKLAEVDRLMVQCNKEGGDAFNFTAIALVKNETTGIGQIENAVKKATDKTYNLAGQRVGKNYKGIVIVNGKKVVVK